MKHSSTSGGARILFVYNNGETFSCKGFWRVRIIRYRRFAVVKLQFSKSKTDCSPILSCSAWILASLDDLRTIEACRCIRAEQKIVVISKVIDVSIVVQAMRWGALDYIAEPQDRGFWRKCNDGWPYRPMPWKNPELPQQSSEQFEEVENHISFLAVSPAMRKIRAQVAQVAKVDIPVLLLGESGVGKEVLARLIHKLSRRSRRTMVKVNCAALPADLLESELFGYEPGAFTGANRAKPGTLELCDKATLFLDEIGEMSPTVQAKLLHVLQDGRFSRLGGRSTLTSDFPRAGRNQHRCERSHQHQGFS